MRYALIVLLFLGLTVNFAYADTKGTSGGDQAITETKSTGSSTKSKQIGELQEKLETHSHRVDTAEKNDVRDLQLGGKFDAPKLVKVTKNNHIGFEGFKDVHNTNWDEGWGAYAKWTYDGCWFNCGE